jgi:sulfur carrier protein
MKVEISVNGSIKEVKQGQNLDELVRDFVETDRGLVLELNKTVIPREQWKDHSIREGDIIELINFVGGG